MVRAGTAEKRGASSPKTRVVRPLTNPIHKQRLVNLKALIRDRFDGKASACAKEVERTHTFIWQLVNAYRAIGEDSARLIEEKLGLGHGTLDKKTGDAFERNTVVTAQLGGGVTLQVMMVPVIKSSEILAGEKPRRRAMAKAIDFVPCPAKCSEDAYAITVDTNAMEPRLRRGDHAVVEPKDKTVVDDRIYLLKVKGIKNPVLRVSVMRDTGHTIFTTPPERKGNGGAAERPFTSSDVTILGRVVFMAREM